MGQAYPELVRGRGADHRDAAARGDPLPRDAGARLAACSTRRPQALKRRRQLAGETAFKLYDTYGFPLDLTQDALRPRGIGVDAQASTRRWSASGPRRAKPGPARARRATEALWFELNEELGATEFLGYETESRRRRIVALIKDGARGRRS